MLRLLFGEPKRKDEGLLLQTAQAIRAYIRSLEPAAGKRIKGQRLHKQHRLAIWSKGFLDALNELEQSLYCCTRYAAQVHRAYVEEMDPQELDDYHRFVYFYKNGFIRVFSILDKLGTFMNDLFELKTEAIKARFSYFTVLRRMHERHIHDTLEQRLYDLKNEYKDVLDRLRNQRNMEIHYINVEMLDDLLQTQPIPGERIHVENVHQNVADLQKGFDLVCRTLTLAFTYISKQAKS
ncbi:hypothetical protein B5M42_013225 [Paenibacillus athensensis]|uniref:Cthe-2314-like HEPN domain-containing protein n=1 Tax=Paenibacillus athensensis TaxID=1967502 RepID=A0A4Y8Q6F4_9BACL|nr:Cthe_2314 family HEPN domain-containing protein [Paenibacillus athensensis]MCD1259797.1 hypothetical protein [Paenibacillus athensensis]